MATRRGSVWIELLLWILFFPVGLLYSVWRLTGPRIDSQPRLSGPHRDGEVWYTYDGNPPPAIVHGEWWCDVKNGARVYVYDGAYRPLMQKP